MKKILFVLLLISNMVVGQQYTTVDDSCQYIVCKNVTLQSLHVRKADVSVHKQTDKVLLVFNSPNYPFIFTWSLQQATAYKGGLNQLYSYLAVMISTPCPTSPPPTPFPTNIDTTHIDTSLILPTLISNFSVNNNDTLSAILQTIKTIDVADTSNLWMINEVYNQLGLINARAYDTSQVDTSMIEPFIIESFSIRNNDTLSAILQELKKTDSVYVVNRDTAVVSVVGMKDTLFTYDLDTSVVLTIDSTYYFQLDSIIKLLQKDTIDFEYHSFCYRSKIDSGVYEFSQVFDVRNPSVPYYMAFVDMDSLLSIFSYMNGTSTGSFPDFAKDYIPCDKWAEYLKRNVASDTLKTLVFKAQTKRIDGTLDTLYNCKGISFNVSANATGNITFYYGDGDQDTYDVASEDLPHWENGSFVEFLGFNASGVSGVVRINMLGCNQTSDAICAKEKPIINCTTTAPIIICSGWASASGIWSTLSGCWNTGQ